MAGLIHLLTLFAAINFVFAAPVDGLLATSGVIAIVLGPALQSSLSNAPAGLVGKQTRQRQASLKQTSVSAVNKESVRSKAGRQPYKGSNADSF